MVILYHTGDTGLFGDMQLIGELYQPELAFLPIGDHYVMGPREAAKACQFIKAKKVIPMHYGTFPLLKGTVADFQEELKKYAFKPEVITLKPGEIYKI